jgi:hypothetical protein
VLVSVGLNYKMPAGGGPVTTVAALAAASDSARESLARTGRLRQPEAQPEAGPNWKAASHRDGGLTVTNTVAARQWLARLSPDYGSFRESSAPHRSL